MTEFARLLSVLAGGGVQFILIGGAAATAHGSSRLTLDLDVVYERSDTNLRRLAMALADLEPYPRDAPPGLPFRFDERRLNQGLHFTLSTTLGELDLQGEIAAGGTFEELSRHTVQLNLGIECRCLDADEWIRVKRAAGRPKDFGAIAELETLRDREH